MMKRGGGQDTSQPGTNVSALAVGVSHLTMALDLKISPRKLMESVVPLQHRKVESQKTYSDCQKRNIGGIHVIHKYAPTGLKSRLLSINIILLQGKPNKFPLQAK